MGDQVSVRDTAELPRTYCAHRTVDLKKDKKFALAVQGLFVLMAFVAVGVALLLELSLGSSWSPILTTSVTLFACLIYMAVHVRPSYGVRFPFLTTGNHAYLTRRSAVVVALAPAVIWGILLAAALFTLPQDYLLTTYILLALNFAGSAGDCVEVYVVSRQQPDALVQDDGDKVHVFVPQDSR
jgi:hypothetical protein